ncbi:ATP-binding protein [Pararobbsia silviterrae]|nr:winged helix-turn-helix domain-containing protein [Pararobbsia silviterrae]
MDTVDRLRFDRFELLPQQRTLLRDGQPVVLRGRAFDLLVALVQRAGRVVTRNELLDVVWPGLVVEDNNVAMQVTALRKVLQGGLITTVPGRGYCFTGRLQAGALARPPGTVFEVSGPLPFGREQDLADAAQALSSSGCLTLAGPGGVGKTTLAAALRTTFPGRTVWLDLASLHADAPVWPALCGALGQPMTATDPAEVVADATRELDLLVLDNAEHVASQAATMVVHLVVTAPRLRVLVTSQVPLGVRGERVQRIEPLALAPVEMPGELALAHGAIGFLVDRIRAADPRFAIDEAALPLLRQLCAALDGLPLALEMAAARVPLMGLQGVLDALVQRFSMLRLRHVDADERHRTLLAAIEWSYGLLRAGEQRLLRALGVFAGGFTVDLVVALMTPTDDERWAVIDQLAVLVDRSLVACDHQDPPRYRLLESTRSFALIVLDAHGEAAAMRARHAAAMVWLMTSASISERQNVSSQAIRPAMNEVDNVRVALQWATIHDKARAVELATRAVLPNVLGPWRHEALEWMGACEPFIDEPAVSDALRREWARVFAMQAMWVRHPRALELARLSTARSRAAGDEWNALLSLVALVRSKDRPDAELEDAARAVSELVDTHPQWLERVRSLAVGALAWAACVRGDYAICLDLRRQAADIAASCDSARLVDHTVSELAEALWLAGRSAEALQRLRGLLASSRHVDDTIVATLHARLVRILFDTERLDEARAEWPTMAARVRRFGLEAAELAVFAAAKCGHPRVAALLLGHARRLHARRGSSEDRSPIGDIARAIPSLLEHLDPETIERLIEDGRHLTHAEADDLLLAAEDAPAL